MAILVFSFLMLAVIGWFAFAMVKTRSSSRWEDIAWITVIPGMLVLIGYITLCCVCGDMYSHYFDTVKTCEKANTYVQAEQSKGVYVYNHHKIQSKAVKLVAKCNSELGKLREYNETFWYDYVIPDEVNNLAPIVLDMNGKIKDPITFSLEALAQFLAGLVD